MKLYRISNVCVPCKERRQQKCRHIHTSFSGGFHYSDGEVWDDITEYCDDCGANLAELDRKRRASWKQEALEEDESLR